MKTENMKLLDLQTGKYLELEKDFYYGGKSIIIEPCNIASNIMSFFFECFKGADTIEKGMMFLQKKALENKQNNISDDVIMNVLHQSEPPLPLKEICDKTGAVVYGGRYVLVNEITYKNLYGIDGNVKDYSGKWTDEEINKCIERTFRSGDIITVEYVTYSPNDYRREHGDFSTYNIIFRDEHSFQYGETPKLSGLDCGNPFEEYSKQLRNEPNKFEELKQYFK